MTKLVPITRDFLREHYAKFPIHALSDEFLAAKTELENLAPTLSALEPDVYKQTNREAMRRIDENIWRNRQFAEETASLLAPENQSDALKAAIKKVNGEEKAASARKTLTDIVADVAQFQHDAVKDIEKNIEGFLPQDFRMNILKYQKASKEKAFQQQIEELVKKGAPIKEKYDQYWNQQMQRRETLVQIGNASGVYKAVIQYIGGVPQTLLDFIKQFNDPEGPMEEYRLAYAPHIYALTALLNMLHVYTAVNFKAAENGKDVDMAKVLDTINKDSGFYKTEMNRYITFIAKIMRESPFFVTKADLKEPWPSVEDGTGKELNIAAWKSASVSIEGASVKGDLVSWQFVSKGKDINFIVKFTPKANQKQRDVQPAKKYSGDELAKGQYRLEEDGVVELFFDNTYSYFTAKTIVYSCDILSAKDTAELGISSTANLLDAPPSPQPSTV